MKYIKTFEQFVNENLNEAKDAFKDSEWGSEGEFVYDINQQVDMQWQRNTRENVAAEVESDDKKRTITMIQYERGAGGYSTAMKKDFEHDFKKALINSAKKNNLPTENLDKWKIIWKLK